MSDLSRRRRLRLARLALAFGSGMPLSNSTSLITLPILDPGFGFLIDGNGAYVRDANGNWVFEWVETVFNGVEILDDDVVAILDTAPASGPILLPQLLIDEWSSPVSSDPTRFEMVYSGDIDASTSSREFVQIEAGEIPIVGARRVDHDDGEDYGFGALGIEYLPTKADGVTRIPDIDGLVVRPAATNYVTKTDGTNWQKDAAVTLTAQTWNGLNGFRVSGGASGNQRAFFLVSGPTNPHRSAACIVVKKVDAHDFVQIQVRAVTGYVNFQFSTGTVTASLNLSAQVTQLDTDTFLLELSRTSDITSTTLYFVVGLISSGASAQDEPFNATGLSVEGYGATITYGPGGTTLPFPGIINNNTGASLTRLAQSSPLAISAADLATRGPELVTNGGFDADSDWTKQAGWTISNGKGVGTSVALFDTIGQSDIFTANKYYELSLDAEITSGGLQVLAGAQTIDTSVDAGSNLYRFVAVADQGLALRAGAAGFTGTIDNISVRELTPNHTIMVAYKQPSVWPSDKRLIGTNGTGGEALVYCHYATAGLIQIYDPDIGFVGLGTGSAGDVHKVSFSVGGSGINSSFDGASVISNASVPVFDFTEVNIGPAQMPIQQLAIIKRSLTDEELQEITS